MNASHNRSPVITRGHLRCQSPPQRETCRPPVVDTMFICLEDMFYILRNIQLEKIPMVCSARFVLKLKNIPLCDPTHWALLKVGSWTLLDSMFSLWASLTLAFSHRLKQSCPAIDSCQRVCQGSSNLSSRRIHCLSDLAVVFWSCRILWLFLKECGWQNCCSNQRWFTAYL